TLDNEEAGPSGDRAERQAGARSGVGQSDAAGGQNTDLTTAGANALSCSEQTGRWPRHDRPVMSGRTFRLQAAQRLLYGEEIAWADMAYALLRHVEDLNYDKHLFVLNLREMDLSATTLFYQSVLRAWSSVLRISRINTQPFPCTEEEPLFHNPLIQSRMISSPYIQQHFRRAGITRVKNLRSGNSWKTARELCAETEALSARLMQRLRGEVASALPSRFREALGQDPGRNHQPPPPLSISAAAGEYQWEKAALLSFQMPILTTLKDASKKSLYETCVKVSYRGSLAGLKESH
ncbi:hypothetical protein QTP70_033415, partial [Hemibagrus guttatus]